MNDFCKLFGKDGDEIIEEAENSFGLSPKERMAMFVSLMKLIDVIWSQLSEEEQGRRLEIQERLDPRPNPWWKNIRPEAIP